MEPDPLLQDLVHSPFSPQDNLEEAIDIESLLTPYQINAVQNYLDSDSQRR